VLNINPDNPVILIGILFLFGAVTVFLSAGPLSVADTTTDLVYSIDHCTFDSTDREVTCNIQGFAGYSPDRFQDGISTDAKIRPKRENGDQHGFSTVFQQFEQIVAGGNLTDGEHVSGATAEAIEAGSSCRFEVDRIDASDDDGWVYQDVVAEGEVVVTSVGQPILCVVEFSDWPADLREDLSGYGCSGGCDMSNIKTVWTLDVAVSTDGSPAPGPQQPVNEGEVGLVEQAKLTLIYLYWNIAAWFDTFV
jgi:hypothetical protein